MQKYYNFCIYANNLIKKVFILAYVEKKQYLCTILNYCINHEYYYSKNLRVHYCDFCCNKLRDSETVDLPA